MLFIQDIMAQSGLTGLPFANLTPTGKMASTFLPTTRQLVIAYGLKSL